MNTPLKCPFAKQLQTAPMKPKPNEPSGGRRSVTQPLLQLFLLTILMAVVCVGCKSDAKVAHKTDKTRFATHLSSTDTPEPAPGSGILSIRATATPASCTVGERTTITTVVSDGRGKPAPGVKVLISAGGGRFLPGPDAPYDPKARLHGPYSASGISDQEGRFVTWWVVNPAAPAYVMGIRATKESWSEAQTNLQIVIKQ
jgi:hypothetical protein